MKATGFTPLESQFLTLTQHYNLGLDDLARVYDMPQRKVQRVLEQASTKNTRACIRLLKAIGCWENS